METTNNYGYAPGQGPAPSTEKETKLNSTDIEVETSDDTYGSVENFDDLELKDNLLRGIYAYGFEKPSVIQQKAIIPVMKGRDVIAQAQSGTGKTATFTIGMLQVIDETLPETQAVILAHTRELASQINNVITSISSFLKVTVNLCVGGTQIRDNIDDLNSLRLL